MTSINIYKNTLGSGLREFFESYEPSIKELINSLDSDGYLLESFSEEKIDRLKILIETSNISLKLKNDFYAVIDPNDEDKTKKRLALLREALNANDYRIGQHIHIILVNTYLAFLERLKTYLLFFIDFPKMGKPYKKIYGLGNVTSFLSEKYNSNEYLKYFNTDMRNSFAHYTFSFKHGDGGKVILYSGIFDENPKEITLVELIKSINEVNVLAEGFYMILRDKYGLPEINLHNMEG